MLLLVVLLAPDGGGNKYTGLLCLLFFTHMIPFLFSCLLLVLKATHTRSVRMLLQSVPAVLLTLWYIAGRFFVGGNADGVVELRHIPYLSSTFVLYKVGSFLKSLGLIKAMNQAGVPLGLPVLGMGSYLLFFGCAVILCGILLVLLTRALLSRQDATPALGLVKRAALLFILLAIVAPSDLLGIADPGARLLQVALLRARVPGGQLVGKPLLATTAIASLFSFILFAKLVFSPEIDARAAHTLPPPCSGSPLWSTACISPIRTLSGQAICASRSSPRPCSST